MQCVCAMLTLVACPVLQYFSTFSHQRHDFWKRLLNIIGVFRVFLQIHSDLSFIKGRIEQAMIENVDWSSCTVPVILVRL
jgi:hypothetical protein